MNESLNPARSILTLPERGEPPPSWMGAVAVRVPVTLIGRGRQAETRGVVQLNGLLVIRDLPGSMTIDGVRVPGWPDLGLLVPRCARKGDTLIVQRKIA